MAQSVAVESMIEKSLSVKTIRQCRVWPTERPLPAGELSHDSMEVQGWEMVRDGGRLEQLAPTCP